MCIDRFRTRPVIGQQFHSQKCGFNDDRMGLTNGQFITEVGAGSSRSAENRAQPFSFNMNLSQYGFETWNYPMNDPLPPVEVIPSQQIVSVPLHTMQNLNDQNLELIEN